MDVGGGVVVVRGALVLVATAADPSLLHAASNAASGAAPAPSTAQRARSRRLIECPRHAAESAPAATPAVCQPACSVDTTRNAGNPGAATAMSASEDSAVNPSKNLPTSHAHALR